MPRRSETKPDLDAVFGPLEQKVLDALWTREEPAVVREVMAAVGNVAYTTVLTTLDRLYRKGVLTRERVGRAFAYRPVQSRDEVAASLTSRALTALMPNHPGSIRPLLSTFVDEVSRRDAALLDELANEVQRRIEEQAQSRGGTEAAQNGPAQNGSAQNDSTQNDSTQKDPTQVAPGHASRSLDGEGLGTEDET